jgi:hypothetical protein
VSAVTTNNYFAKATFPAGNQWRTPWLTKDAALAAASKFVSDWAANGLGNAEACVFYRDGSIVEAVKRNPTPEVTQRTLRHDSVEDYMVVIVEDQGVEYVRPFEPEAAS